MCTLLLVLLSVDWGKIFIIQLHFRGQAGLVPVELGEATVFFGGVGRCLDPQNTFKDELFPKIWGDFIVLLVVGIQSSI